MTDSTDGFDGAGKSVLYATSESGGFISTDNGASWHAIVLPGTGARVRAVATSQRHPQTAYISYSHLKSRWGHLARSCEDRRRRTHVAAGLERSCGRRAQPLLRVDYAHPGNRLGRKSSDARRRGPRPKPGYYHFGRTLASTDGGKNWYAKYSRPVSDASWTTTGLNVTTDYGVHFYPSFDNKRQFITYTDIGLFRTVKTPENPGCAALVAFQRSGRTLRSGSPSIRKFAGECGVSTAALTICRARRCGVALPSRHSKAAYVAATTAVEPGKNRTQGCRKLPPPTSCWIPKVLPMEGALRDGLWPRRVQEQRWRRDLEPEKHRHHPARPLCLATGSRI